MSFDSGTSADVYARETRPRSDSLAGLRDNLVAALALLEGPAATALAAVSRKLSNRLGPALEATRRELRRALEATDAGPG